KAQQPPASHLLKGETVSFGEDAAKPKVTDEELNSRIAKGDIRIVTESARYSLAGILAMLRETVVGEAGEKELRYKLDPEYQRRERDRDRRGLQMPERRHLGGSRGRR